MLGSATVTRMAGERSNKMSKEDTMRLMVTKRGFSLLVGGVFGAGFGGLQQQFRPEKREGRRSRRGGSPHGRVGDG